MKEIIKGVTAFPRVSFDENNILSCWVSIHSGGNLSIKCKFILSEPISVTKLEQLMKYTSAYDDVDEMHLKFIRVVVDENLLRTASSVVENSFFKYNGEFAILTQEEIIKE